MKKVELIPAYEWTCDECGAVNFSRSQPTLIENLPQEIRDEMYDPLMPFEDGEFVLSTPDEVMCKECKTKFGCYMECRPTFGPIPPDEEVE